MFTLGFGRGEDRATIIAHMKRHTLKLLDKEPVYEDSELGRLHIIHYESDMMAGHRPNTPRDFRYPELRPVDNAGKELEDKRAMLNLSMQGKPARPYLINAAEISPYFTVETNHNCAVYALVMHCELPLEEVQSQMKGYFRDLYPAEKLSVCLARVLRWCSENKRSCYFWIANQLHTKI